MSNEQFIWKRRVILQRNWDWIQQQGNAAVMFSQDVMKRQQPKKGVKIVIQESKKNKKGKKSFLKGKREKKSWPSRVFWFANITKQTREK